MAANIITDAIKFIDTTGASYGVKHAANKPRVSSMPYLYDIAVGNISGHEVFFALGYNPDIDNIREDLIEFGGTYIFPPAGGIQMKITSSSANDAVAGTGVRTVDIDYLDNTHAPQSETITMNGITPVNTVATNILRVQKLHTETAGSGGMADGTIILTDIAGTATYAQITAGGNYSRCAIFTVPAGKTAYIVNWNAGVGGAASGKFGEFTLRSTSDHKGNLSPGIFQFKKIAIAQDGAGGGEILIPIKVPATADIKISAVSDSGTANAICAAYFEGWLE